VPSGTRFGIQVQNSPRALVDGNTIHKLGGIPSDTNYRTRLYGISMETNCYTTQVSNNGLIHLGSGVQYFGSNNFPSVVSCNSFTNNYSGVVLNNTFIGDQGLSVVQAPPDGVNQDNQWVVPNSLEYYSVEGKNNSPIGTLWYYRTNNINLNPNPLSIYPLYTVAFLGPQPNSPVTCTNYCPNGPCQQQQLIQIAQRVGVFDSLSGSELFMSDQTAYHQLQANHALMQQGNANDQVLTNFFNQHAQGNIGKIDAAYQYSSERDTAQAMQAANGIVPNGTVEFNHQQVLKIYLRTWARGQLAFSAYDSAILFSIAMQNVQHGGTAVYDARVMLDLDVDDVGANAVLRTANTTTPTEPFGNLYPNPSNEEAIYETMLNENETGFIILYDVLGNEVARYVLSEGDNRVAIKTQEFATGIYLYQVWVNDVRRDSGKLAVQH
jgi:hypothetical protein